jgi:hypothetical protein
MDRDPNRIAARSVPIAASLALHVADAVLAAIREYGARLLNRIELRLEVWRLRMDPATKRWIEETHKDMADGAFMERVKNQPTPREAVDQILKERERRSS